MESWRKPYRKGRAPFVLFTTVMSIFEFKQNMLAARSITDIEQLFLTRLGPLGFAKCSSCYTGYSLRAELVFAQDKRNEITADKVLHALFETIEPSVASDFLEIETLYLAPFCIFEKQDRFSGDPKALKLLLLLRVDRLPCAELDANESRQRRLKEQIAKLELELDTAVDQSSDIEDRRKAKIAADQQVLFKSCLSRHEDGLKGPQIIIVNRDHE